MKHILSLALGVALAASMTMISSKSADAHKLSKRQKHIHVASQKTQTKRQRAPKVKVVTKRERGRKIAIGRHFHPVGKSHKRGLAHKHKATRRAFNHSHGKHLTHTHNQRNIIDVSPKQTKWTLPHRSSSLTVTIPTLPWEAPKVQQAHQTRLALVVVDEQQGVNIIRNVKTFTTSVQDVRSKVTIGSSTILRPEDALSDIEIDRCNRRLKVIDVKDNVTIIRGDVGYCQ